MGSSAKEINIIKPSLHTTFTIKDIGAVKYFRGLEIARSEAGMFLNQHKYTVDLLTNAGLMDCNPTKTPLPPYCKLSTTN